MKLCRKFITATFDDSVSSTVSSKRIYLLNDNEITSAKEYFVKASNYEESLYREFREYRHLKAYDMPFNKTHLIDSFNDYTYWKGDRNSEIRFLQGWEVCKDCFSFEDLMKLMRVDDFVKYIKILSKD